MSCIYKDPPDYVEVEYGTHQGSKEKLEKLYHEMLDLESPYDGIHWNGVSEDDI